MMRKSIVSGESLLRNEGSRTCCACLEQKVCPRGVVTAVTSGERDASSYHTRCSPRAVLAGEERG